MTERIRVLLLVGMLLQVGACGGSEEEQASEQASAADSEATAVRPELAGDIDWATVDSAMGRAGSMQPGGVYKYGMPRSDLDVITAGVQVEPALALGSWLALMPSDGGGAVAMGDLVLTEEEYHRVIARLRHRRSTSTRLGTRSRSRGRYAPRWRSPAHLPRTPPMEKQNRFRSIRRRSAGSSATRER